MFTRIWTTLFPNRAGTTPSPPLPAPPRTGSASADHRLTQLQAEIEAELDASGAVSEAQRQQVLRRLLQEKTQNDAEAMAALVRAWILEDRSR